MTEPRAHRRGGRGRDRAARAPARALEDARREAASRSATTTARRRARSPTGSTSRRRLHRHRGSARGRRARRRVVVATPNHLHEPHVLSALAAGMDVLCERPLALTARGVERIVNAAGARRSQGVRGEQPSLPQRRAGARRIPARRRARQAHRHSRRRVPSSGARSRDGASGARSRAAARSSTTGFRCSISRSGSPTFRSRSASSRTWIAARARTPSRTRCSCSSTARSAWRSASTCSARYVGEEERWWFETLSTRGSTRLAPLRVVKELHGRPTDVSPRGAAARESAFIQSYRAELAHFVAVVAGRRGVRGAGRSGACCTASSRRSTSRRTRGRRSDCEPVAPLARHRCCSRRGSVARLRCRSAAQTPRCSARRAPSLGAGAGSELTVTLMTFGLGEEVFERFGHNALWIHDGARGTDVAYNWGLFSFRAAATSSSAFSPATRSTGWAARMRNVMIDAVSRAGAADHAAAAEPHAGAEARPARLPALERARGEQATTATTTSATTAPRGCATRSTARSAARCARRRTRCRRRSPIAARACGSPTATSRCRRASTSRSAGRPTCRSRVGVVLHPDAAARRDTRRPLPIGPGGALRCGSSPRSARSRRCRGRRRARAHHVAPRLVWRLLLVGVVLAALLAVIRIMAMSRRGAAWGFALVAMVWSLSVRRRSA